MGTIFITAGQAWENEEQTQSFTRNNCDEDEAGTLVAYTVIAGTYTSPISQGEANQLALDDITANGQDYANDNGDCEQDVFYNEEQSDFFTRNDCLEDFTGSSVEYVIPAGTYSDDTQLGANALAIAALAAEGQDYANGLGECTRTTFWNQEMSDDFVKSGCGVGEHGSTVTYTVSAHTYSSGISVEDANTLAQDDITDNGQAYANTNGECLSDIFWENEEQSDDFERNNCDEDGVPSTVTYTVAAGTYISYVSQLDANNQALADIASNGQSYANTHGTCTYWNEEQFDVFIRDNCDEGYTGEEVTYTVAAHTYSSLISVALANAAAVADISANGQAYANTNGDCFPPVEEQDIFSGFGSPAAPFVLGEDLEGPVYALDASLDCALVFNPETMTGGGDAIQIAIPHTSGSTTRPTGGYYHAPTNKYYANSFNGGGLTVIDCDTNTITAMIPYGTNGSFSRGNVNYLASFNEIWAYGNTGLLRINADTDAVVPNGGFTIPSSTIFIASLNNKVYVFADNTTNQIKVYNSSLSLIKTITGFCSATQNTGAYVSRGAYVDVPNQKIYLGEISSQGGVIIFDLSTDTIAGRLQIDKEGKTYCGPQVIAYHPIRNALYLGGSIFNNPSVDSVAKLWLFNPSSVTITQTVNPSANVTINGMIYYPANNSVYVLSPGLVPENSPNTGHTTDGIIFEFN